MKLYAWEEAFEKLVTRIRNTELRELCRGTLSWGVVESNWIIAPFVVLLATFATYISQLSPATVVDADSPFTVNNVPGLLTPEKIFVSLTLFGLLRIPLTNLPYVVSMVIMVSWGLRCPTLSLC